MSNLPLPNWVKASPPYQLVRSAYLFRQSKPYQAARQRARTLSNRRLLSRYLQAGGLRKLQIGAGQNVLGDGWLNSDLMPERRDIYHLDATKPFPIPSSTFDLIFCEHTIEHFSLPDGVAMLKESFRVLRPGGRIRVSTPPLDFVIKLIEEPATDEYKRYLDWHFKKWLPDTPISTPAVVLNDYFRNWGHLFIYDEPTLRAALTQAGFSQIERFGLNESPHPALCNLENETRMPPGLLKLGTMTFEGVRLG